MAEHIRASVSPAPASRHVINQYNWPGFCMACNEVGKVFFNVFEWWAACRRCTEVDRVKTEA